MKRLGTSMRHIVVNIQGKMIKSGPVRASTVASRASTVAPDAEATTASKAKAMEVTRMMEVES